MSAYLGSVKIGAVLTEYSTTTMDTSDATAIASEVAKDKIAYVDGKRVIGTFTIENEIEEQDNLISQIQASIENFGHNDTNDTSNLMLQDKVIIPTSNDQEVTYDEGYDGLNKVTVEGDVNLVAENIAKGVSIFGVLGDLVAGGEVKSASGSKDGSSTLTVTGLDFTPSVVFVFSRGSNSSTASTWFTFASPIYTVAFAGTNEYTSSRVFTPTEGGFTLTGASLASGYQGAWYAFGV